MYCHDGDFFANRQATRAEREVYGYIRCLARLKDSDDAIEAFYSLLFRGVVTHQEFNSNSVRTALVSILDSPDANEILPYVINRCFYTIGNLWRIDSHRHTALRSLVTQAKNLPKRKPTGRQIRRLVGAMETYVNNDNLYIPLQRQMRLLSEEEPMDEGVSLGHCFKDYFFIYESVAITRDIPLHYRKSIQLQRQKRAQQLNQQLCDYWQAYRQGMSGRMINPTRLDHGQLTDAIYSFHPERRGSYRHQARAFEAGVTDFRTTGEFVDPFYSYIMEPLLAVDDRYQTNRFSKLVKDVLADTAGPSRTPLTGISINQMCTHLLKLLVSNTVDRPEMAHFKRLVDTAGAKAMTAVLLKLVLFRRTIRSWFEDRFGILFHVRESFTLDKVAWLVDSFEYMNVALALNAPWINYMPRPVSPVSG
ncbi:MAG: hypothetical protein F6K31_36715 [Symploca sp. SIO2G7]|nr:hypothetical protein [Symploca sp. SIO2G7]